MMDLHCAACGHDLPPDAAHTLMYCVHCGAPQLELSEELRDRADAARNEDAAGAPDRGRAAADAPGATVWRGALDLVMLSAVTTAILSAAAYPVPGIGALRWLWFIASPVVVLGVYGARFVQTRMSASLGARVGLLTGLANLLAAAVVTVVHLAWLRHAGALGGFDAMWTSVMQQSMARASAMGDPGVLGAMDRPEFRVAWVLASVAMFGFVLLVLATVGGAFAGLLRSRERAAAR